MVAPDQNALRLHLGGQVPVADVPGQAQQGRAIGRAHLQQGLARGDHLDQPSILKLQRRAAGQQPALRQIQQHAHAMIRRQGDAAAVAALIVQGDVVADRSGPMAGRQDVDDALHGGPQNRK